MQDTDQIFRILQELETIPNVPFLPIPRIHYIENFLKQHHIEYVKNDFAIITKPKQRMQDQGNIFCMSHLDHPGIVLKNSREGKVFGTIYVETVRDILADHKIAIRIFRPNGAFQGIGYLTALKGKYYTDAIIETELVVKPNSFAQWDVGHLRTSKDHLYLYSGDNDIPTAVLLTVLAKYPTISGVFNFYEEVHQYSSYALAKKNLLQIKQNDILINLECALNKGHLNADGELGNTYDNGCILQIGQHKLIYGYKLRDKRNQAEDLIRHAAKISRIHIQDGITKGSDDSRSFTHFPLTPHLVTLVVPNKNKHNITPDGRIDQEELRISDITDMYTIVTTIASDPNIRVSTLGEESRNKSYELKQHDVITDINLMKRKKRLNERLNLAYAHKAKRGYFYPTTLSEIITDFFYTVLSYGVYLKFSLFPQD